MHGKCLSHADDLLFLFRPIIFVMLQSSIFRFFARSSLRLFLSSAKTICLFLRETCMRETVVNSRVDLETNPSTFTSYSMKKKRKISH